MYEVQVSRKLLIASIATFIFVLLELAAGLFANSLSLIGDAFHNFTDTLALLLALFAVRLERAHAKRVSEVPAKLETLDCPRVRASSRRPVGDLHGEQ